MIAAGQCAVQCGQQAAVHERHQRVGLDGIGRVGQPASLGQGGRMQAGHPVGGQEGGVAGRHGQPRAGAGAQAGVDAGQRPGQVGVVVGQHRQAEAGVPGQLAVGIEHQRPDLGAQIVDQPGHQRAAGQRQQAFFGAGHACLHASGRTAGQHQAAHVRPPGAGTRCRPGVGRLRLVAAWHLAGSRQRCRCACRRGG